MTTTNTANNTRKRTAGPWHVGMHPGPMVYGPQGEQVADCTLDNGDHNGLNARLIAAAPDMLDTLRNVAAHFNCVGEEDEAIAVSVRALLARVNPSGC